jgi:methyl coenzyme M reductase subunit C-like uncharacterized protein (methanogenesis marker protein 7)
MGQAHRTPTMLPRSRPRYIAMASSVARHQLPVGVKDVSEWLANGGKIGNRLKAAGMQRFVKPTKQR